MTDVAEKYRTPFLKQNNGGWVLILREGKTLEWGHRFDAGIGYRVFIKWADAENINAFPTNHARRLALQISQSEFRPEVLTIAKLLRDTAKECDRMNKLWTDAGAPDVPVDQIKVGGNA